VRACLLVRKSAAGKLAANKKKKKGKGESFCIRENERPSCSIIFQENWGGEVLLFRKKDVKRGPESPRAGEWTGGEGTPTTCKRESLEKIEE